MTSRKIVAIWGGENGRLKEWNRLPYETGPMDQEIVRLTGKEHPNFLLLAHSQPLPNQEFYDELEGVRLVVHDISNNLTVLK